MTEWTMIKPGIGKVRDRAARTTPAVRKSKASGAYLVLPKGFTNFPTANVYSDGNGKLAFHFCDGGAFKVASAGKEPCSKIVRIPNDARGRVPFGTTDAELSRDGDLYVLDLSQFARAILDAAS